MKTVLIWYKLYCYNKLHEIQLFYNRWHLKCILSGYIPHGEDLNAVLGEVSAVPQMYRADDSE